MTNINEFFLLYKKTYIISKKLYIYIKEGYKMLYTIFKINKIYTIYIFIIINFLLIGYFKESLVIGIYLLWYDFIKKNEKIRRLLY